MIFNFKSCLSIRTKYCTTRSYYCKQGKQFCTLFQMGENGVYKLNELNTKINVERNDVGGKHQTSIDPVPSRFHDNDHHSSKTM
jgi:hypothetical protein